MRQLRYDTIRYDNSKLNEKIYMKLPTGITGADNIVRLKKTLYGLKQSRQWNKLFNQFLSLLVNSNSLQATQTVVYIKVMLTAREYYLHFMWTMDL